MRVVHRPEELAQVGEPVVLAVGFFDGVHKGHRAVITEALDQAREHHGQAWVLTFDPHPLKVIRPEAAPPMLTSTPHKVHILDSMGVHGCIVMPFTPELRHQQPQAFIEHLCGSIPRLAHVVVGSNWRFGHGRKGNVTLLEKLALQYDLSTSTVPPVSWQGGPVSSTRVRDAVYAGELQDAAALLGRPFSVWGDVIEGDKTGRRLGYPTANVDPHNEVHPPSGIYAVYAVIDETRYAAAAYIGRRPTFAATIRPWVVEVYLLDVELDLYGKQVEVLFMEHIRKDRQFSAPDELSVQIARDVGRAREILAG